MDSFYSWGLLHHGDEVQSAVLGAKTVVILRLTDLDICLERGLIIPTEKVLHVSARVNANLAVIFEVFRLQVDLFVAGDICLKVVVLMLAPVLECVQLLLELPSPALSKTWSKKCGLEFLLGSAHITGLVELVNAGVCGVFLTMSLSLA